MGKLRNNSEFDIHPIIAERWSPRAFDENRSVEPEKLAACLEAARWSSSCFGAEPWRFIVVDKSQNPQGWQQMLDALVEKNQLWAQHAPVLVLACASNNFAHNGNPNRWAQYDTGQAMMSFSLQATAVGLITHPMGGFDPSAAAQAFHIPNDYTLMSVAALGYLGAIERLHEDFRSAENADRNRKAIHDIAFSTWNEAWNREEKT